MKTIALGSTFATLASLAIVSPSFAGIVGPAPLLGAGLPGLAVLGAAGVGYVAMRVVKNRKR